MKIERKIAGFDAGLVEPTAGNDRADNKGRAFERRIDLFIFCDEAQISFESWCNLRAVVPRFEGLRNDDADGD